MKKNAIQPTARVRVFRGRLLNNIIVCGKRIARRGHIVQAFALPIGLGGSTKLLVDAGKIFVEIRRSDLEVCVVGVVKVTPADLVYPYVVPEVNGKCKSIRLNQKNEV